jgi:hypothetical protein
LSSTLTFAFDAVTMASANQFSRCRKRTFVLTIFSRARKITLAFAAYAISKSGTSQ